MVRTALRVLKLWKVHAYLDLMWMTRDTRYFLICYFSDVFIAVASVTSMLFLAERFGGVGNWSKHQMVFMLGYGSMLWGLVDSFFGYNVSCISRRLGRGQFDHTLILPQPVWMTLLTEGFSPVQNSAKVLPGLALVVWSVQRLSLDVTPAWGILFTVNMIASGAIMLSLSFIWGSLAFWSPRSAEEISSAVNHFTWELRIFPLNGLSPVIVAGLLSFLPVGFTAWYPCRALLGMGVPCYALFVTPAVAAVFLLAAACVFCKGMKHYAKTGSQRYLGWGHRS